MPRPPGGPRAVRITGRVSPGDYLALEAKAASRNESVYVLVSKAMSSYASGAWEDTRLPKPSPEPDSGVVAGVNKPSGPHIHRSKEVTAGGFGKCSCGSIKLPTGWTEP